ncbi:polysaccharide deacetylase family protein [Bifidobacterium sp. ESL0775]|uniref:polysaccharide deacetylase family protein n=1 Tax=Bifidobacterium sp. ESL0775 TaxID=2983230 RepID=UPI0023F92DDC|nr:polysaccharide deacetylase family protein [Bifidobacterium sp. ESL0775]WEV69108.1 polysaccharide deacetylase family protein [Bifidobacterium sp. ESL0775]
MVVVVVALAGVGAWGYGHFRHIPVSVNGADQQVGADTTLGKLMRDNNDFDAKPGKLLSVSGKVLKAAGGDPVAYTLNGQKIAAGDADSVKLSENAKITVKNGKDVTEKHDVQGTPVPFNVVINGHGVIQKLRQVGKDGSNEVWTGKISGEKVDKGEVKKPQDLIVDTFSPQPQGKKVIALTFDDGPSQYSGPILDILKNEGVKATFFDVGEHAVAEPQMEQRMLAEGHQVASHSNTHPDMWKLNEQQLQSEISQGLDNLKKASNTTTKMLRAPYGNFGADQWRYSNGLVDYNVIWTIDTKDWKLPGAPAISNEALSKAYNGAVVLMHDGGGDRTEDIAALPGIIDGLKAQGFEFVTIDQLIAMNGQ